MKIIPLKEGNYAVDKLKNFTPLTPASPATSLKMAIQPFLIIVDNNYILLDTGIGTFQPETPGILKTLQRENIGPRQITHVFLSHLHKDHLDGIGTLEADRLVPHFPQAKIYAQKREYEFAITQSNSPSYRPALLQHLPTLPGLTWLQEEEGHITPHLFFQVTGGHSPFHQVCWIKDQGQTAFYGADNLPQKSYLKANIAYKTDYDGRKARQWRQRWVKTAKEENWSVLLYHDLNTPVLTLQ